MALDSKAWVLHDPKRHGHHQPDAHGSDQDFPVTTVNEAEAIVGCRDLPDGRADRDIPGQGRHVGGVGCRLANGSSPDRHVGREQVGDPQCKEAEGEFLRSARRFFPPEEGPDQRAEGDQQRGDRTDEQPVEHYDQAVQRDGQSQHREADPADNDVGSEAATYDVFHEPGLLCGH